MTAIYATIMVMTSTSLSLIYKLLTRFNIRETHFAACTTLLAFAIEFTQLSLVISGVALSWNILLLAHLRLCSSTILDLDFHISTWLAATGTLAIHALAILTIDLIDNLIQLKTWRHPVQIQTLLLTRSILFPATVRRRSTPSAPLIPALAGRARGRSRTRKMIISSRPPVDRTHSEPATPTRLRERGVQFPSETRRALVRASSITKPCVISTCTPRTFSIPTGMHYQARLGEDTSSSCEETTISTPASLVDIATLSSPLEKYKRASTSSLHLFTPTRTSQKANSSTPDLNRRNTTCSPEQPALAHEASTQISLPAAPTQPPTNKSLPAKPESLQLIYISTHAPAFAAGTFSSSLKMRPRARVRTMSAQSRQLDGMDIGLRASSSDRAERSGRPCFVRDTVELFERQTSS